MEVTISICIFVLFLNQFNMVRVVRELSKLIMFIIIWGFPILLVHMSGDTRYLWLFILSCVVNVGMFTHYEDLEAKPFDEDEDTDEDE